MSCDEEQLNLLIARIYDTALDDALWPTVVNELALLVGAAESLLFYMQSTECGELQITSALVDMVNIDNHAWYAYEAYYKQHDIWTNDAAEKRLLRRGNIIQSEKIIPHNKFLNTEYYCDFAKPMLGGIDTAMCTAIFDFSTPQESPPVFLGLYKRNFTEAFTSQDERLIRHLLPHLQRALAIRWKMAGEQQMRLLREQALNQVSAAVLLLDESGRILFVNRIAESLLRSGGNPSVLHGRLCCVDPKENNDIKRALRQTQKGIGCTLRLNNAEPGGTRIATFSPIMARHADFIHVQTRIMVMITEPNKPAVGGMEAFAKLYPLTAAETRVLEHLLKQQTPREIAENLQIRMPTLRSHLRALFAKTNTKNQRELIQLFLSQPPISDFGKI